jgi:DNA repair protein RadC
MPDYELLELLLYFVYPRQDVKPKAKALLEEYGSLSRVIHMAGASSPLRFVFQLVQEASRRLVIHDVRQQPVLNNTQRVLEYCHMTMAHLSVEQFRILFLDRKYNLIADDIHQSGTIDQTALYPREVLKRALEISATYLMLVHNHPSGDPSPSSADITLTQHLKTTLAPLGIRILDHFIIGRFGHFSFRAHELLSDS